MLAGVARIRSSAVVRRATPFLVVVLAVAAAVAAWMKFRGPQRIVPVEAGSRLLGLSGGLLYWLGPTCSIWRATLGPGGNAGEPEAVLRMGECPPDDPRIDGAAVYFLGGMGTVQRIAAGERTAMLRRTRAFALAADARYLYVGNCELRDDCRIERVALNGPAEATLLQAGIHNLANMEVDRDNLFWVDRGRPKTDPMPPRLMAAPKDEPRALERVVANDFDGRRPFLGARHVYWLGAQGVRRAPKSGGASELVLPTTRLTGFAADGPEVFVAADAGIFRSDDGGVLKLLQRTASPPSGLAIDAGHVYWIETADNAVMAGSR